MVRYGIYFVPLSFARRYFRSEKPKIIWLFAHLFVPLHPNKKDDGNRRCNIQAFIDKLQIIRRATNLFDRKSLAIHPASTIFGLFTPEQCAEMSVPDTTVRLSIGLEDGEDLLEDIRQALK